jgi:hypothetical protein
VHDHSSHGQPFKLVASALEGPFYYFQMSIFCSSRTRPFIPWTTIQTGRLRAGRPILIPPDVHFLLQMYTSFHPMDNHSNWSPPRWKAHFRTSKCPFNAAYEHVHAPQGQPFKLVANSNCSGSLNRWKAHWSTSKCPLYAAEEHVISFQGQPFKLVANSNCSGSLNRWKAHWSTSRCPFFAAFEHVITSHGQPFSLHHFKTCSCPLSAAFEHVVLSHGTVPFKLGVNSNCQSSLNRWKAHFRTSKCPFLATKLICSRLG